MKPLFKSADHQKKFEEDGFVKVPLLNTAEVEQLLNVYRQVAAPHEKVNLPYITTSLSFDPGLIAFVDREVQKVMAPAIERFMQNYKLLFGNFLIKMPVDQSETEPHQDITFVDESQFASVNIWVGLQDTDYQNGCMYFLKGTQHLINTLRPACKYEWEYENVKQEIVEMSEAFPAKAGEAFIFNHAVLHGSYPNKSNKPRVAAVIAAYSEDAPLIHYYLPGGKGEVMEKYEMTREAFMTITDGQPPAHGIFLNKVGHRFKRLNKTEFNALMRNKNGSRSLLSSIGNLFKNLSL